MLFMSNRVTIPKLPDPPLSAIQRSACSSALAFTILPSARTTSKFTTLSHAQPCEADQKELPPPRMKPPAPTSLSRPPVTATPYSARVSKTGFQRHPGWIEAVLLSTSYVVAFMLPWRCQREVVLILRPSAASFSPRSTVTPFRILLAPGKSP